MNVADIVFQAEKFLDYTRRGEEWRWWESKGFSPDQRRAIEEAISMLSAKARTLP